MKRYANVFYMDINDVVIAKRVLIDWDRVAISTVERKWTRQTLFNIRTS